MNYKRDLNLYGYDVMLLTVLKIKISIFCNSYNYHQVNNLLTVKL